MAIALSTWVVAIVAWKTFLQKAQVDEIKTTAFLTKLFGTRKISLAITQIIFQASYCTELQASGQGQSQT